jgi:hypothetical protein
MLRHTGLVRHNTVIFVETSPKIVGEVLSDLSTHVYWNDVVAEATPASGGSLGAHPAWITTLRANVGPFSRSKKLRMTRTENHVDPEGVRHIRFERREIDGRDHAGWIMEVQIRPDGEGSAIDLGLEYTGGLWVGALEGVLSSAIDRATMALPDYLAQREAGSGSHP